MVVYAVKYEPVSTWNSLIRAILQGIFAKNCLFCNFAPDFCWADQRLRGKFPTIANRELLRAIRDSVPDNSDLLRRIRQSFESQFVDQNACSRRIPACQTFFSWWGLHWRGQVVVPPYYLLLRHTARR